MIVITRILIAATLFASAATAQPTTRLSLQPYVQKTFGESSYILDFDNSRSTTNPFHIKSELVFPQDLMLAGAQFQVSRFRPDGNLHRSLTVRFGQGITDPKGIMTDSDWDYGLQFSYTESPIKTRATQVEVEWTEYMFRAGAAEVSFFAGYRFYSYQNSMTGYSGWYLPYDSISDQYANAREYVRGNELSLLYDISYHIPQLGLSARMAPSRSFTCSGMLAYGFAHVKDRDIHLLRGFSTSASGFGKSVIGRVVGRWEMGSPAKASRPYIQLGADYLWLDANIGSTHRYYTDSPDTPDDETGLYINGLPHEITTKQLSLSLAVGLYW